MHRLQRCNRCNSSGLVVLLAFTLVHSFAESASGVSTSGDLTFDLLHHSCATEPGQNSYRHEDWLNRLSGKKLVLVGDSVTRYQYLALSYYLVHGVCADPKDPSYVLDERRHVRAGGWQQFYKETSKALTVKTPEFETQELCLCARLALTPLHIRENRSFVYRDVQGRHIQLIYIQYFTEDFARLTTIMSMVDGVGATDVLLNFGVWFRGANPSCADHPNDKYCPQMDWLCQIFKADHPYKLWWQGTTGQSLANQEEVQDVLWPQHHMNVARRCNLTDDQVLDRQMVLDILEPNRTDQKNLFWKPYGTHVLSEGNHGFNRLLVRRLTEARPSRARRMAQISTKQDAIWKRLFAQR